MSQLIRVASVGPGPHVQGGVTRVIALITARLPRHIQMRHITTFTQYTGDKEGIKYPQKAAGRGKAERSCVRANVSKLARVLFRPRTGTRPEEALSSTATLDPYPDGGVSEPEADVYGPRCSASMRKG